METLDALFKRYARRKAARWWTGPRPEGRPRQLPGLIAAQVGYSAEATDLGADDRLAALTRKQAAHMLAIAGTTSLAHGPLGPRESHIKDAFDALAALNDDATFLSSMWDYGTARVLKVKLTDATFECGVLGYDATHAFIFWVEEED